MLKIVIFLRRYLIIIQACRYIILILLLINFISGIEYEIDRTSGSCSVYPLERDDLDATNQGEYIIMKRNSELFDYDGLNVQYVGQVI